MNIAEIITNSEGLYEGDLKHYFKIVFSRTRNLNNGYHNFRHLFHVLWACYQACVFYKDKFFSRRERRNLLIAAMFHDFDHSGRIGQDDLEVERAIRGFKKHVLRKDRLSIDRIVNLIRITEFPHRDLSSSLDLDAQILRDADLSQSLDTAWIQQIIFGLAEEMNISPLEILKRQEAFYRDLEFSTEWAKQTFSQENIRAKIKEVQAMLNILED